MNTNMPADLRAGVEQSDIVTTIDGLSDKNYTIKRGVIMKMTPPHPFVQKHPDPSVCPYCHRQRVRILALVDESIVLAWDGKKDKESIRKWQRKFDKENRVFREHREECE